MKLKECAKWLAGLGLLLMLGCQREEQASQISAENSGSGSAADLGPPLTVSGDLYSDVIFSDSNPDVFADGTYRTTAQIRITAELAENIRLVLGLKIKLLLEQNGVTVANTVDIEKWIKEAYIEIKNVGGKPVAFIVGKHKMAFGQHVSNMPMYEGSGPLYDATQYDQVIGFTVALTNVPFFDLVEASVFETTPGDLSVGTMNGASVRLTKQLTEQIKAEISALHAGHTNGPDENRVSLGFVFSDGKWTTWVEGLYLDGSKQYPKADFAATLGASREWGPGKVVVEATYVQNSLAQIGLGYQCRVNSNLTVGPEVRYTHFENGEDDVSFGVRARITFEIKH